MPGGSKRPALFITRHFHHQVRGVAISLGRVEGHAVRFLRIVAVFINITDCHQIRVFIAQSDIVDDVRIAAVAEVAVFGHHVRFETGGHTVGVYFFIVVVENMHIAEAYPGHALVDALGHGSIVPAMVEGSAEMAPVVGVVVAGSNERDFIVVCETGIRNRYEVADIVRAVAADVEQAVGAGMQPAMVNPDVFRSINGNAIGAVRRAAPIAVVGKEKSCVKSRS